MIFGQVRVNGGSHQSLIKQEVGKFTVNFNVSFDLERDQVQSNRRKRSRLNKHLNLKVPNCNVDIQNVSKKRGMRVYIETNFKIYVLFTKIGSLNRKLQISEMVTILKIRYKQVGRPLYKIVQTEIILFLPNYSLHLETLSA